MVLRYPYVFKRDLSQPYTVPNDYIWRYRRPFDPHSALLTDAVSPDVKPRVR